MKYIFYTDIDENLDFYVMGKKYLYLYIRDNGTNTVFKRRMLITKFNEQIPKGWRNGLLEQEDIVNLTPSVGVKKNTLENFKSLMPPSHRKAFEIEAVRFLLEN